MRKRSSGSAKAFYLDREATVERLRQAVAVPV